MSTLLPNGWTAPVNGLSARLRVLFEDLEPGLRHAVYLELKNRSTDLLAVTDQPRIQAELDDPAGERMRTADLPTSGPMRSPQWAVCPRDAYVGFRIDMQTVGLPTREQGMALIAIGGRSWMVKAGKYALKIDVACEYQDYGPRNQWVGHLELPPVHIEVTPEMVTAR